MDQITIHR